MKYLIVALASMWLATSAAHAERNIIINNYQTPYAGRFCWGLIGCLIARSMDEQDRQTALGPHACNVWNGRQYVRGTCAP